MIKNLIVIPLRHEPVGGPTAICGVADPRTKSRDLLKGKARSSSRGQQKAAPKGGASLASSVEPKLGQAERAGVLTAVGHEAHPHEAKDHHCPSGGLGNGADVDIGRNELRIVPVI